MTEDARDSVAARIDPGAKLVWLLLISVAGSWFTEPASLASIALMAATPFVLASRGELSIAWKYKYLILFVPSLLLFYHFVIKSGFSQNEVEFADVKWGATAYSLKILSSVVSLTFLLSTTDMRQLVNRIVRFGLPVKAAFTVYLTLRFIEILRVDASSIREALQLHRRSSWLKLVRYPATLVFLGLQRAEQTASAMDLRGFPGGNRRTYSGDRNWSWSGWSLPGVTALIAILIEFIQ